MKTILLPTDFSRNSINAINYAVTLFKDIQCEFYLLNVQKASSFISDDMMVVSSSATIYKTIIEAAKKSIANIISRIERKYKNDNHQFHSLVDYDNFIDSINQVSKKHDVDLILMGTKGATGLQKVIFGSNTVRVMQRCKVPVLAIPDNCVFSDLNKVAFTTNHVTLFHEHQLKSLKDLIQLNKSKLFILHIADENHLVQSQSQNIDLFNSHFLDVVHDYIDVRFNDMYEVVHQYIIENDINMLAMMSEKHSFLERLFNRHPVETFAFNIDIPFLVMPDK